MVRYFLKRLGMMLVALFMIILLTFVIEHSIPGGPFTSDRKVTPEVEAALNEKYHLNDPLPKQFLDYLVGILHGDLGPSYKYTGKEVTDFISNGFPVSAKVGALGIAVALAAGIPLGIVAAVKRGKLADGASMVLATIGVSVPSFVLCVLMMYVFCEKWKIFPSYGLTSWKHYVLPVFCMAFSQVAYITRLMRSSMLETMRQDYIRTERSKGVPEWEVISKYALKNSILPVVTYVGPLVATLLTGTFIIEKLFSIPGLGRYFISAITDRDYSVTLGLTVFLGVMIIGCNLIVDIMYAVIDPRVKITE